MRDLRGECISVYRCPDTGLTFAIYQINYGGVQYALKHLKRFKEIRDADECIYYSHIDLIVDGQAEYQYLDEKLVGGFPLRTMIALLNHFNKIKDKS